VTIFDSEPVRKLPIAGIVVVRQRREISFEIVDSYEKFAVTLIYEADQRSVGRVACPVGV
jgi:hypothetical protein